MISAPLLTFCLAVLLLAAGSPPLQAQDSTPRDQIYYFPHLAVGASWQTTITYINFSSQEVTCQTDFLSDYGSPLMVSFAELGTVVSRTDVLPPGGSVHQETDVDLSASLAPGWARATCSGPVQASLLFRGYNSEGMPVAEAGVNAATVPATRFVTFAEQGEGKNGTGVAYANPSDTAALVTFTARDADGEVLAIEDLMLPPNGHDAQNMSPLFDLSSFTGSLEVTSTEPIVSLSLNFEAAPVFSSLPPGELDASAQGSTTYYFPHLAVGASWQTTITYINYSPQEVTCQTDFISDHGTPLMVSFAGLGTVDSRTDVLPPGGSVHQETDVDLNASLAPGWARATCSGPVQASLLYRLHNSEGVPTAEAGVNATAVPATRFVTFAEQGEDQFGTGVAYANPSPNISVPVTFTARDGVGEVLAKVVRTLSPGGHDAHGMAELFGLTSFTGSLEVTSTEPIVSLSLNFEAAPVFSSLPPGETPGEMLAPTDEAAFNDLFVGMRATTNFPAVYVDFVSPGRFRETRLAVTLTGSYTYRNTGSDAGTLTFNYDDGDRCTAHLTFVSTTAGTATYTCNDGSSGGYNWLLVAISATGTPDLVVQTPSVSDSSPNAGGAFTLSATVRNQGNGLSASTTLRYYRSPDATISTSDTAVGTDAVGGLAASGTSAESISLTAPSTAGTYYYGACVDPVSGESDTGNNCSNSSAVTVPSGSMAGIIPDANLRAAVEAALNKASGAPISAADMEALTRLTARDAGVSDLTGLEFATNLTELKLDYNDISDVSSLAGLTNLTELYLRFNTIADVSSLGGLTNLTDLALDANEITDVSSLGGLTNLTWMSLDANKITDVSGLGDLTNLRRMNLAQNAITDASGVGSLANLTGLGLAFNAIMDVSLLDRLTNLQYLDLQGNPLSLTSINDHLPALERNGVTVRFDRLRKGDFDIELVFLGDFIEGQKSVLQYAARRWMSVITEDLPDYEFTQGWSGTCGGQPFEIPSGERIDDLRIYVGSFEDAEGPSGYGGTSLLRESYLPIFGCMTFNSKPSYLQITGLHEVGHVVGFGRRIWGNLGFFQDTDGDQHFNGPLAIAAFDDAGGRDYTGKKVPVEGSHWRYSVLRGELMGPRGGPALSAITVQSLADLGYGVDVTQADPYTLPGAAAAQASAKQAVAMPAIPEDDRLSGHQASPAQVKPKVWCGLDGEREPIYVVDQEGRVIRTIGN